MTLSTLLAAVYRFYPKNLSPTSPGYGQTPERARLIEAARRGADEYPTWQAMVRRLGERYPVQDSSIHLLAGWVDSAYTLQIWPPGKEAEYAEFDRVQGFRFRFGCHVSLLGPYSFVRHQGLSDEEPYVRDVAQEIEATYGYEPIPPHLGNVIVPDVAFDAVGLGKAKIYDCLLSTAWGS